LHEVLADKPRRSVILIGGSQGAVPALKTLLRGLPPDFNAAVGITIHRAATTTSTLPDLFRRHCSLPIEDARHGELFRPGRVYLAPPDQHLLLRSGAVWLDHGPKQQHVRPAVDPMFASGAKAYGARVIGVLLTGNLSDGVAGLVAIKQRGGLSLVQDPREAEAPSMPRNAIVFDHVDAIFLIAQASHLLRELVAGVTLKDATEDEGAVRPS
jgi:two-component system, chemotaxis family, protein-glutamate methylesterase/glutaminase